MSAAGGMNTGAVIGPPVGVAVVNLVPAARVRARKNAARVALWAWIVPVCCGMLVAAYVVQRLGGTAEVAAVREAMEDVKAKIKENELRVARQARELQDAGAVLRANRAVGEQPDWSLLLALVTDRLGNDAALTSLRLEPVAVEPAPGKAGKDGGGGVAGGSGGGRPERLALTIKGVAKSQGAASRFVLELEKSPAFDKVSLVETKRSIAPGDSAETITFQIACELLDPGAGGGGSAGATAGVGTGASSGEGGSK